MKEFKNIDELFEKNLSEFKIVPGKKSWDNLESELFSPKKAYLREIATVVVLLLIAGATYWYLGTEDTSEIIESKKITDINNAPEKSKQQLEENIKSLENSDELDQTINNNTLHEIPTTEIIDSNTWDLGNSDLTSEEIYNATENNQSHLLANNNSDDNEDLINNTDELQSHTLSGNSYMSIHRISSRNNGSLISDNYNPIGYSNSKISIDEYIEKKRNIHIYTGASISAGIMYYNDTPDMFTWGTDLSFGYRLKDFYIESGIGYQQVKQHGDYRIDYQTNDSVGYYQEVVSFELNPDNYTEITYNTKTTTVFDSVSHYNHTSPVYQYNYINIPLKVGYTAFNTDNVSLSVESGIIYSMLNSTVVPTLTYNIPESTIMGISNNTPDRVANNFKLHMALRATYRIHNSLSISIQPEFSKYLNSIYSNPDHKHMPYSMSIRGGLFFNF